MAFNLNAQMIIRTKVLMGTFVSISLQEKDKMYFNNVFKILKEVDNSISSYKQNSPIFILNKSKKAKINLYTYEALELSEEYYKKTDGYFDIAIGSITKDLYKFGGNEHLASALELDASNISISNLKFDKKEAFLKGSVKIDLGGMGKGFGVDKSIKYLKNQHVTNTIVALSGDIRCLGSCKIAVNNPFGKKPLAEFDTIKNEMGISTSGNYNRYVHDTKHNHLINPKTKNSQNNFVSITLISQLKNSDLDAYATAVSVMPPSKTYLFLDALKIGYIVLTIKNKLVVSKNIDEYVENLVVNDTVK